MSDREQEIERIAQEEVYPERHNRVFAEWPSARTKEVHMQIAEARYNKRQAEASAPVKKTNTRRKAKSQQVDVTDIPEGQVEETLQEIEIVEDTGNE